MSKEISGMWVEYMESLTEGDADTLIETPEGHMVLCRQIAGAMARRIVTYAKPLEECYIDEHMGFIKFGSRVDVFLPLGTEVCVTMGQKTTGDLTMIGRLPKKDPIETKEQLTEDTL